MNLSQKYHSIFDYKLVRSDYPKWSCKAGSSFAGKYKTKIRLEREQISQMKLIIAQKASEILSKISTVKFVGVTGSLAMLNAKKDSDIDLMIITKSGSLWLTRLIVLMILVILHIPFRRAKKRDEANKLCLNMWLDENDLVWNKDDRNIYTAHEIAQVRPLVNKDKTHEKFLWQNRWLLSFWPYAVSCKPYAKKTIRHKAYSLWQLIEWLAYKIQYFYMKKKITREIITPTRAIFHPNDWGKVVMEKLNSTQKS